MNKVTLTGRGGRAINVHPRVADAIVQRGGYMRRDMHAQDVSGPAAARKKSAAVADDKVKKTAKKAAAKTVQPNKDASE